MVGIEDILNDPVYQKYPRLYATAKINNLNIEMIDGLVNKALTNKWSKDFYKTTEDVERGLKIILVRMNDLYPESDFITVLKLLEPFQYTKEGLDIIMKTSGKRHFPLMISILR